VAVTAPTIEIRHTTMDHALVAPMFVQLAEESFLRDGNVSELRRYSAAEFTAPHGACLVLLDGDRPLAGGAFLRHDATTARITHLWTHSAHRRRGLGRRMLTELETEAAARGYRRLHVTVGCGRPEATGLYAAAGYSLSDWSLAYEKHLH
jgi:GNAT superfamily N-acetyltransferase